MPLLITYSMPLIAIEIKKHMASTIHHPSPSNPPGSSQGDLVRKFVGPEQHQSPSAWREIHGSFAWGRWVRIMVDTRSTNLGMEHPSSSYSML